MARRKKTPEFYKETVKFLRETREPYLSRDGYDLRKVVNWSSARKAAITRVYRDVQQSMNLSRAGRGRFVLAKNIKHRKAIQEMAGFVKYRPKAKRVFIQGPVDAKIEVKYDRKTSEPTIIINNVAIHAMRFDDKALVVDPRAEVRRVLALLPKAPQYAFKTGKYVSKRTYTNRGILEKIDAMVGEYGTGIAQWLIGLESLQGTEKRVSRLRQVRARSPILP